MNNFNCEYPKQEKYCMKTRTCYLEMLLYYGMKLYRQWCMIDILSALDIQTKLYFICYQ